MNYKIEPDVEDIIKNLEKKELSKKRKNSSKKGKRAENNLCHIFEKKFEMIFSRVPESGAMATRGRVKKSVESEVCGDIITPDNFKFVIESKKGYDLDIINFFYNEKMFSGKKTDKKTFESFLKQVEDDSKRANKEPMLIYYKDYRPPIIATTYEKIIDKDKNYMVYFYNSKSWFITSLYNILNVKNEKFFN